MHLVDNHFYVVILVAVNLHTAGDFLNFAVNAHGEIALATHLLKELAIVSLATTHQGCKDENALAGIVGLNHVNNLLLSVLHHGFARHVAIGFACPGKEQAQIVIDFSSSTYGRAGILVGGLLLNTDDGRKTADFVNVRTFHSTKKVPGIG